VEYYPNVNEIFITIGVWAMGAFILTLLYKIAIGVEHEIEA
jgi:molybdopterin-containing oxidoreductase family membrane subunit